MATNDTSPPETASVEYPETRGDARQKIAELENIQSQITWWRWGTTIATAVVVIGCIASINSSVQGLINPGTRQEIFVNELSTGLQEDVLPDVQELAEQAIIEVRPEAQEAFVSLQNRLPELAEESYEQLNLLQQNLPERGEKVLENTFGEMLDRKEARIREMFPNATEENVRDITQNLSQVAQERAALVSDKLFAQHMNTMENIVQHMEQIRLAEAQDARASGSQLASQPNWEMAIAVLDVVRDDLRTMVPKDGMASGNTPTNTAMNDTNADAEDRGIAPGDDAIDGTVPVQGPDTGTDN
ncbi:MAG: hypothetical protein OHK0029_25020 [Armatimonadaceae bacterium]